MCKVPIHVLWTTHTPSNQEKQGAQTEALTGAWSAGPSRNRHLGCGASSGNDTGDSSRAAATGAVPERLGRAFSEGLALDCAFADSKEGEHGGHPYISVGLYVGGGPTTGSEDGILRRR